MGIHFDSFREILFFYQRWGQELDNDCAENPFLSEVSKFGCVIVSLIQPRFYVKRPIAVDAIRLEIYGLVLPRRKIGNPH